MLEALKSKHCADVRAWVEGHAVFPELASPTSPGRVSLARQPWMSSILADFLDPAVQRVSLVMGTQTGKTTCLLLATMLLAEFAPAPLIWALPTDDLARKIRRDRLIPALSASLPGLFPKSSREISGGMLPLATMPIYTTGVQTPAKLSSTPAAYIIADESAKFEHLRRNEASPLLLLQERTKSFPRRLIVEASTPNTADHPFWQGFLESDQRHFYVPCPHCGAFQKLVFSRASLVWDHPADGSPTTEDLVLRSARYICQSCSAPITEEERIPMLQKGYWKAENPAAPSHHRGYHLSSMYSPFQTFGEIAVEFFKSVRSSVQAVALQNFANSWEALPYATYTARVTDDTVTQYIDHSYKRGELPVPVEDMHYIVTTYDPGQNATHWLTTLIAKGGELWVIDWGTLTAFTSERGQTGPAAHVDTLYYGPQRAYPAFSYVDSGDWTQQIYRECERSRRTPLTPTKGSNGQTGRLSVTSPQNRPWQRLVMYSDFSAKVGLYAQIMGGNGARLHLPADTDAALVHGLSGQTLETKNGRRSWKSLPDDHYGDCLKLALVSWWIHAPDFEPAILPPEPETAPSP